MRKCPLSRLFLWIIIINKEQWRRPKVWDETRLSAGESRRASRRGPGGLFPAKGLAPAKIARAAQASPGARVTRIPLPARREAAGA